LTQEATMTGSMMIVHRETVGRDLVAGNFRAAGFEVGCAADIPAAESMACTFRPDLVLLEWAAGAPALAFARQLRSDRRTASAGIIVVSDRSEEQDRVAALECGADDYVTRPFSVRELLARARAVLRRRSPQLADAVVEVSGLRFDPGAMQVSAAGRAIELRKIEFQLLHFLITHPHRICSRRKLLDEVWGDHVYVEERTVDVHIRRLRRALAPSGHGGLIETVRGIGYRFRADPGPQPAPALHATVAGFEHARGGPASAAMAGVA
jgi:two-component system phosphate regulon response regulator PhoB